MPPATQPAALILGIFVSPLLSFSANIVPQWSAFPDTSRWHRPRAARVALNGMRLSLPLKYSTVWMPHAPLHRIFQAGIFGPSEFCEQVPISATCQRFSLDVKSI